MGILESIADEIDMPIFRLTKVVYRNVEIYPLYNTIYSREDGEIEIRNTKTIEKILDKVYGIDAEIYERKEKIRGREINYRYVRIKGTRAGYGTIKKVWIRCGRKFLTLPHSRYIVMEYLTLKPKNVDKVARWKIDLNRMNEYEIRKIMREPWRAKKKGAGELKDITVTKDAVYIIDNEIVKITKDYIMYTSYRNKKKVWREIAWNKKTGWEKYRWEEIDESGLKYFAKRLVSENKRYPKWVKEKIIEYLW